MDEIVKQAFDIANYSAVFASQKKILEEEFNQATIFFQNGGSFSITREFICFVKALTELSDSTSAVLIDDNNTPIEIQNIQQFLQDILSKYMFAINGYYTKYSAMRSARSIQSIVNK